MFDSKGISFNSQIFFFHFILLNFSFTLHYKWTFGNQFTLKTEVFSCHQFSWRLWFFHKLRVAFEFFHQKSHYVYGSHQNWWSTYERFFAIPPVIQRFYPSFYELCWDWHLKIQFNFNDIKFKMFNKLKLMGIICLLVVFFSMMTFKIPLKIRWINEKNTVNPMNWNNQRFAWIESNAIFQQNWNQCCGLM